MTKKIRENYIKMDREKNHVRNTEHKSMQSKLNIYQQTQPNNNKRHTCREREWSTSIQTYTDLTTDRQSTTDRQTERKFNKDRY